MLLYIDLAPRAIAFTDTIAQQQQRKDKRTNLYAAKNRDGISIERTTATNILDYNDWMHLV